VRTFTIGTIPDFSQDFYGYQPKGVYKISYERKMHLRLQALRLYV